MGLLGMKEIDEEGEKRVPKGSHLWSPSQVALKGIEDVNIYKIE